VTLTEPGYKIDRRDGLTAREREVLDLLRQGMSQVEIGEAIGVSKQRVGQILLVLVEKGKWDTRKPESQPESEPGSEVGGPETVGA
jgi:DNA-directed RNA polymerase sigma subunit (sigma70/sigma32)